MYENGKGVDKDYRKAFELYQQAANSGYFLAQNNLAKMYKEGKGTEIDMDQAIYWYEQAGNEYAQRQLEKLNY